MTQNDRSSAGRPGVVGRDQERARLDAFVTEVPAGPRALAISGDPGIGKTTLWRYALAVCRSDGIRVLVSRPAEEEQRLALTGLTDLFEVAGLDEEAVGSDEPFERGRAVLTMLRRLSAEAPTVIAIDDVQWLDGVSAHALRYALRRLDEEPLGVLATIRSGTVADPLATDSTLPPGRAERVDIGPFTIDETRQLLVGVIDAVSRPLLRRIHEISGGNPLYALELGRTLATRGSIDPAGALSARSIQMTITERLAGLPAPLTGLLETMAASGRLSADQLRSLAPDGFDEHLAELTRQDLVVVDDDLHVSFVHPLVGSAVFEGMDPLSRRSLHARLAEAATDPDIEARHLARSVDDPNARVAQLLEDAASRAASKHSSELAADLARHSVRLTPSGDLEAVTRRSRLLMDHLAEAGEVSQALEVAHRLTETLPPGTARAELFVARARLESDDVAVTEELLTQALEETGEDELLRGRVLDQLGWVTAVFRGDVQTGLARSREALAIAQRAGDLELEMSVSTGIANIELYAGSPGWALLERAVALESEIEDSLLWAGPRVQLAQFHRIEGDLARARELFQATHAEAMRSGKERWRPYGLYNLAGMACHEGDFVRGDELIHQALDAARDTEDPHIEAWSLYTVALVATWLGRTEEARDTIERLVAWGEERGERPALARGRAVHGLLLLSEGDAEGAAERFGESVARLESMGIVHPAVVGSLPDAVEASAAAGDRETALALLRRMEDRREAAGSRWVDAATDRARGHVLSSTGEPAEAAELLDGSAQAFDAMGFAADAARARFAHGRALRRAGQRTVAADALTDALSRFRAIQAPLWCARVEEELERVAPGRTEGTLTVTEGKIAALVAEGRRNKEIAAALFVSVATVEAHLTRVYRKLQIRTRNELARMVAAGEVELTEPDESGEAP